MSLVQKMWQRAGVAFRAKVGKELSGHGLLYEDVLVETEEVPAALPCLQLGLALVRLNIFTAASRNSLLTRKRRLRNLALAIQLPSAWHTHLRSASLRHLGLALLVLLSSTWTSRLPHLRRKDLCDPGFAFLVLLARCKLPCATLHASPRGLGLAFVDFLRSFHLPTRTGIRDLGLALCTHLSCARGSRRSFHPLCVKTPPPRSRA